MKDSPVASSTLLEHIVTFCSFEDLNFFEKLMLLTISDE